MKITGRSKKVDLQQTEQDTDATIQSMCSHFKSLNESSEFPKATGMGKRNKDAFEKEQSTLQNYKGSSYISEIENKFGVKLSQVPTRNKAEPLQSTGADFEDVTRADITDKHTGATALVESKLDKTKQGVQTHSQLTEKQHIHTAAKHDNCNSSVSTNAYVQSMRPHFKSINVSSEVPKATGTGKQNEDAIEKEQSTLLKYHEGCSISDIENKVCVRSSQDQTKNKAELLHSTRADFEDVIRAHVTDTHTEATALVESKLDKTKIHEWIEGEV
ncbi:hypothetical protein MAR_016325, partial [Mya arenaria]